MARYTVVESKVWKHTSGRTASIYGALPWYTKSEKEQWTMESRGYTIRDNKTNEIGRMIRKPFATFTQAQEYCDKLNS